MSSLEIDTTDSFHTSEITDDSEVFDPETGLEKEPNDSNQITDPFDPEQIKIRTATVLIEHLVTRIKYEEIDLTPDFQRLRGIWNSERKSRLIESLLLRIPIPVFYVASQENDDWSVVDGLQRMSTIFDFVSDKFGLEKLQYLTSFENLKHSQLPRPMQRRISETQLIVNVIDPGTPPEVMFNIFLRINTGGLTLNGQEIRHAMHRGPVRDFLQRLAESQSFLQATDHSVRPTRMADRECVLRFLAFYLSSPDQYSDSDLDSYLAGTMKAINRMNDSQRAEIEKAFDKAMKAAYAIFGDDAFRKRSHWDHNRRAVSRALFEVWSVHLARLDSAQIATVLAGKEKVKEKFMELMNIDSDFDRAISYSTGGPQRVHKRFDAVKELLEEILQC